MARRKTSAPKNKTTLYPDNKRLSTNSSISSNLTNTVDRSNTSRRKSSTPKKNTSAVSSREYSVPRKYIRRFGREELISVKTLQNIRYLQSTVHNLIPKLPFSRLVREIMMDCTNGSDVTRVQASTLQAIQEAAELYLVCLFSDCNLAASHANRKTIHPKDMGLVLRLRENQ